MDRTEFEIGKTYAGKDGAKIKILDIVGKDILCFSIARNRKAWCAAGLFALWAVRELKEGERE